MKMKISKLLSIFGILLIIFGIASGLKLNIVSDWESYSYTSSYTFKFGTVLLGLFLVFAGYRVRKSERQV